MTVFKNEDRWDVSNVEFRDGGVVRYAKGVRSVAMRHIDYGLGMYRAEAFAYLPDGAAFDLAEVQTKLIARGEMAGFEVKERFYEIGSEAGLAETDAFLREALLSLAGAGA